MRMSQCQWHTFWPHGLKVFKLRAIVFQDVPISPLVERGIVAPHTGHMLLLQHIHPKCLILCFTPPDIAPKNSKHFGHKKCKHPFPQTLHRACLGTCDTLACSIYLLLFNLMRDALTLREAA